MMFKAAKPIYLVRIFLFSRISTLKCMRESSLHIATINIQFWVLKIVGHLFAIALFMAKSKL